MRTFHKWINPVIGILPMVLLLVQVAAAEPICATKNIKPREVSSLEEFSKIAILNQGRVKPLDTYARNLLLQFSGRRIFDGQPAINWLARLLFASSSIKDAKVFIINSPEIPMALGFDPDKKRRYSFSQLEKGANKLYTMAVAASKIDEENQKIVDKEILRVYNNLNLYANLTKIFDFTFPHPDFYVTNSAICEELEISTSNIQYSFLDISLKAEQLRKLVKPLNNKPFADLSKEEQQALTLWKNLYRWAQNYNDTPLMILPPLDDSETWVTPQKAIHQGFQDPQVKNELVSLRDMVVNYWNGDQLQFDLAARTFHQLVQLRGEANFARNLKTIPLELSYNRIPLFLLAKLFYLFSIITFLIFFLVPSSKLHMAGYALSALGFICHLAILVIRLMIMARSPVTNLFETFLFVGFVGTLIGLVWEKFNKRWLGLFVANICGFLFLTIAGKYSSDGDTMGMLMAVLNSNFWLSTHVISISIGYAGCCVAGIIGHIYILQGIFRPKDTAYLNTVFKSMRGALGFGLAMTFLGTTLGGIWADASWGRFWGWDPKENGALLIILWAAFILHAKAGKMIGPLGFAIGNIFMGVVVAWAWFGVNLLNIGLHSYGFTSGIVMGLCLYVLLEVLFVFICVPQFSKRCSPIKNTKH